MLLPKIFFTSAVEKIADYHHDFETEKKKKKGI
jgi:hypothetical protein